MGTFIRGQKKNRGQNQRKSKKKNSKKKKKKKHYVPNNCHSSPGDYWPDFFFFFLPVKTGKTGKKNLMFLEILAKPAKPAKPAKSKGQEKILNAMGPTRTALSLSILFLWKIKCDWNVTYYFSRKRKKRLFFWSTTPRVPESSLTSVLTWPEDAYLLKSDGIRSFHLSMAVPNVYVEWCWLAVSVVWN